MATYDFGKYSITDGGEYSDSTTYDKLTRVSYPIAHGVNATWISKKQTTGHAPARNSEYWQLEVKDGDIGSKPIKVDKSLVLISENWEGESGSYSYDLSTNVSALMQGRYNENLYVEAYVDNDNATVEQIQAVNDMHIKGTGKQKVYANCDTAPNINIPYIIIGNRNMSMSLSAADGSQIYVDNLLTALPQERSWDTATSETLRLMMDYVNKGLIDPDDYYAVGDERTFSLAAVSGQPAVDATFVIMQKGLYKDLNNKSVNFITGMKNCLPNSMQMHSSSKYCQSWAYATLRSWCNSTFLNAFSSDDLAVFKQFKSISGNTSSNDYFSLPAEKEVYGYTIFGYNPEANQLTQFEYFKTASNRLRDRRWWLRTPIPVGAGLNNTYEFCSINTGGNSVDRASFDYYNVTNSRGVCPFGCI
mgnify:CR=1 FL=1